MSKIAPFSLLLSQPNLMASSSGVKGWSKIESAYEQVAIIIVFSIVHDRNSGVPSNLLTRHVMIIIPRSIL